VVQFYVLEELVDLTVAFSLPAELTVWRHVGSILRSNHNKLITI
jgi:hypothetical protein